MSTQYSCYVCGTDVDEDASTIWIPEADSEMPVCANHGYTKLIDLLSSGQPIDDDIRLTLGEVHELGLFMANVLKNGLGYISLHDAWESPDHPERSVPAQIFLDGRWDVSDKLYAIMSRLVQETI